MSRCHGSKTSGSQQGVVLQIWQEKKTKTKTKKFGMHDDSCA